MMLKAPALFRYVGVQELSKEHMGKGIQEWTK